MSPPSFHHLYPLTRLRKTCPTYIHTHWQREHSHFSSLILPLDDNGWEQTKCWKGFISMYEEETWLRSVGAKFLLLEILQVEKSGHVNRDEGRRRTQQQEPWLLSSRAFCVWGINISLAHTDSLSVPCAAHVLAHVLAGWWINALTANETP